MKKKIIMIIIITIILIFAAYIVPNILQSSNLYSTNTVLVSFETFDMDHIDSIVINKGETVTLPTELENEFDCVLEGWYKDPGLLDKFDSETRLEESIILYANFTACSLYGSSKLEENYNRVVKEIEESKIERETQNENNSKTNDNTPILDTKAHNITSNTSKNNASNITKENKSTDNVINEDNEEIKIDTKKSKNEEALLKAKEYAEINHYSKKYIYNSLISDLFTIDEATYAINTLEWDYNNNAYIIGLSYYNNLNLSKEQIYKQLTSSIVEGFTEEEATYAINEIFK